MKSHIAVGLAGFVVAAACLAFTGRPDEKPTINAQDLPPGMTPEMMEMMQVCMEAGTPGDMHEFLMEQAGTWKGEFTMWAYPGAEPQKSSCTWVATPMMDGRYLKGEMTGEIPGMGAFHGFGINGFDNVSQKFVGTWLDNHSTGLMTGTGTLSKDKKTLSWDFTFNCPVTKQPAKMREIDRRTGPNSMTLEMYGTMPGEKQEFKMMELSFTRENAQANAR